MSHTHPELLQKLRDIGVVSHQQVTLRSGVTSDVYCDMRRAYGDPEILNALADAIGEKLSADVTCIAASGYGGLPLGAVVASRFGKKFVAVRDSVKDHGTGSLIHGHIPTIDDAVVIIDDILTTGSSIRKTLEGLSVTPAKVVGAIVCVKRGDAELGVPCDAIFHINELK